MFRAKMGKLKVLEAIGPALSRSKHWIEFGPDTYVYPAVSALVDHLVETYGLEVIMKDGGLHNMGSERSWSLPENPEQAELAMTALKRAEPMLEARPYVTNGASDTLAWAVFSSSDWAELEAADLYAVRALFPQKGKMPERPVLPKGDAERRQRDPAHEALLAWVTENNDGFVSRLVEALDKLETSHPDSTEERDALSQLYRIERRAKR
jgi:hypothetical protein